MNATPSLDRLTVDRDLAQEQLLLLGCNPRDRVYLRSFPPAGSGGKPRNHAFIFPSVPSQQNKAKGLYFVVNPGGHKDRDITEGRALFWEWDDRPIAEQLLAWQDKGLEPNLQVTTRKSVHNYVVINGGCSIEQWRELQSDLLEWMDADRTLKNPSRVMRLAGSWHVKPGHDPVKCEIVHRCERLHTYEELREMIPRHTEPVKVNPVFEANTAANDSLGSSKRSSGDLSDFLKHQIYPRLSPTQAYNWTGHDWQGDRSGDKMRGKCPWHNSQSGTAFHIEPNGSSGEWLWHCPGCDIGGSLIEYRHRLRGGSGNPRGKEFVELVQDLASEAGVQMPEKNSKTAPLKKTAKAVSKIDEPENESENKKSAGSSKLAAAVYGLSRIFSDNLRFNQASGQYELNGVPKTQDELLLYLAMERDYDPPENFQLALQAVAKKYHPVREYLDEVYVKYGDDLSVLDGFANRYFGSTDPLHQEYIRKWLTGIVARAQNPGCKLDVVLVLNGKQGYKKSSFFEVISNGFFDDSVGKSSDKDERLKLHRNWIIEWGEVESVFRAKDISTVKSFITCKTDWIRPPYGKEIVEMPRWSAIVASTNEKSFLADSTGSRRFWVIPVSKKIDTALLKEERDRVLAAAMALYKSGESWWFEDEGIVSEVNEEYATTDPWEQAVVDYLQAFPCNEGVAISSILSTALQLETKEQGRREEMRVADILKRMGWDRERVSRNGKRAHLWFPPKEEDLTDQPEQSIENLPVSLSVEPIVEPVEGTPQEDFSNLVEFDVVTTDQPVVSTTPCHVQGQNFFTGDQVRYRGRDRRLGQICGNKLLTVESVDAGGIAKVTHDDWGFGPNPYRMVLVRDLSIVQFAAERALV